MCEVMGRKWSTSRSQNTYTVSLKIQNYAIEGLNTLLSEDRQNISTPTALMTIYYKQIVIMQFTNSVMWTSLILDLCVVRLKDH